MLDEIRANEAVNISDDTINKLRAALQMRENLIC